MIITYGFARQRLDEQQRMVREHLVARGREREAVQHAVAPVVSNTHATPVATPVQVSPNVNARTACAERPA